MSPAQTEAVIMKKLHVRWFVMKVKIQAVGPTDNDIKNGH
jgi:hypothetical protein